MNAYQEFKIIGSRPVRPDGLDKVTGRARYGADLNMQGQLYGHVFGAPMRMRSSNRSTAARRWRWRVCWQ
jgi:CO/xanthine dehydrogenase Mo-binding subunit